MTLAETSATFSFSWRGAGIPWGIRCPGPLRRVLPGGGGGGGSFFRATPQPHCLHTGDAQGSLRTCVADTFQAWWVWRSNGGEGSGDVLVLLCPLLSDPCPSRFESEQMCLGAKGGAGMSGVSPGPTHAPLDPLKSLPPILYPSHPGQGARAGT